MSSHMSNSSLFSIPTEIIYPPYGLTDVSTSNPFFEDEKEEAEEEEEYIRLPDYVVLFLGNEKKEK